MTRRDWGVYAVVGIITAVLLAGLFAARLAAEENDPRLWRIYYQQISDLLALHSYDLLEFNNLDERYVLAYLDAAQSADLRAAGWRLVAEEPAQRQHADFFFSGYHTVDEIYARLAALAADYPTLTELVPYGESRCRVAGGCVFPGGERLAGHELLALRVSNEARPGTSQVAPAIAAGEKPVFFLIANIHAREIATPELALRWLDFLLEGYGVDPDITWLVDEHELWVVPTANPDGHWIVELGEDGTYGGTPLLHRKNANQDADRNGVPDCPVWPSESFAQFGVDLNRHHSYGWRASDPLSGQCSATYSGPAPATEPEVAELENLLRALIADQRGPGTAVASPDTKGLFITLHSYSELVLRPWGFLDQPAPNEAGLKAIGDRLAAFNGYTSCQPGQCLYLAAGTSDDWAYGELGIPAFTFEVGRSFTPPYAEINSELWPLNGPALFYAARIARAPYEIIEGPEVVSLGVTPGVSGNAPTLFATFDEAMHGGEAITGAVFSIGAPPWAEGAQLRPLAAADGAFDSALEVAEGTFNPAALPQGRYLAYVQGYDAAGNWGDVRAVFVAGTATAWQYLPLVR